MIRTCSIALLAGLTLAGTVLAQQPSDTTRLPELVVTATRYPVAAESIAATLTVLPGEELRAQGIRFVSEALRQVPGLHVVESGSFGAATSLFLRGGESDYVKVLVDGVPVNQPGGAFDFSSLTTDNIERIEILRGPASVLYGSDAIAGVVQIVTRAGGGTEVRASLEAGTYGTARWDAAAQGGRTGLGWSATVSQLTTDGSYPFNNDYRNTSASALLRARAGARNEATLSARYSDGKFNFPTDFTGAVVDHDQFTTSETTTLSLNLSNRPTDALRLDLLVGRNAEETGARNRPDPPPGPQDSTDNLATVERRLADVRALFTGVPRLALLAGASFEDQEQESFPPFTDAAIPSRNNWGFYGQAVTQPHARLRLTLGGRLDENERFGSFWTYRVSALGVVTASTRARASVGSGFKEPSFFENFATGFVTGNPDLKPERSFSLEGGFEQALLSERVSLGVTGFVQRFRDLIQFTFSAPEPGAPNYFNIAAANANGIEATARVRRVGPLAGAVSYTHLWTRVTDAGFEQGPDASFVRDERLIRRPDDLVTVRLDYTWRERVRLGAVVTYVGPRDDIRFAVFPNPTQRVRLPGYTTLDLSGNLHLLTPRGHTPGVTITARLENLLDEHYEQAAGFPARGRTVLVGLASRLP